MHGGDELGESLINIIARRRNTRMRSPYKYISPSEMNLDDCKKQSRKGWHIYRKKDSGIVSRRRKIWRRWRSNHRRKKECWMYGGDELGESLINIIARRRNTRMRSFYKYISPPEMNLDDCKK